MPDGPPEGTSDVEPGTCRYCGKEPADAAGHVLETHAEALLADLDGGSLAPPPRSTYERVRATVSDDETDRYGALSPPPMGLQR